MTHEFHLIILCVWLAQCNLNNVQHPEIISSIICRYYGPIFEHIIRTLTFFTMWMTLIITLSCQVTDLHRSWITKELWILVYQRLEKSMVQIFSVGLFRFELTKYLGYGNITWLAMTLCALLRTYLLSQYLVCCYMCVCHINKPLTWLALFNYNYYIITIIKNTLWTLAERFQNLHQNILKLVLNLNYYQRYIFIHYIHLCHAYSRPYMYLS